MSIIFYDHLIYKTHLTNYIDKAPAEDIHKHKAKQLIDDILHQSIIAMLLERLDPKKHHIFLYMIEERPYDPEILIFLRDHLGHSIDKEIAEHAKKILEEIKKDFLSAD